MHFNLKDNKLQYNKLKDDKLKDLAHNMIACWLLKYSDKYFMNFQDKLY